MKIYWMVIFENLLGTPSDPSPQTNYFITQAEDSDITVYMYVSQVDTTAEVQSTSKLDNKELLLTSWLFHQAHFAELWEVWW